MKRLLSLLLLTLPDAAITQSRWVQGRVTDHLTHRPVEGAQVRTQEGTTGVTDSDGRYKIETSEQNEMNLTVEKEGYATWNSHLIIFGTKPIRNVQVIELVREEGIIFKVYGRMQDGRRSLLEGVHVWQGEEELGITGEPGLLRSKNPCSICMFLFKKEGWVPVDTTLDTKDTKGLHIIFMDTDPSIENKSFIEIHQWIHKHTQRIYQIYDNMPEGVNKDKAIRVELDSIKQGYKQVMNLKQLSPAAMSVRSYWYARDNAIFKILYENALGSRLGWEKIISQRKAVLENIDGLQSTFAKKNAQLNETKVSNRAGIPALIDEMVSIAEKIINKTLVLREYGQNVDNELETNILQLRKMLEWEQTQCDEPDDPVGLKKKFADSYNNNKKRVENLTKRIH